MTRKRLIGALSLVPPIYALFFIAIIGAAAARQGHGRSDLPIPFGTLLVLHLTVICLTIGLLVVYVRDAYVNPLIDDDKRVFWAVVLFLGNVIAMPVYWWLYMRREAPDEAARRR